MKTNSIAPALVAALLSLVALPALAQGNKPAPVAKKTAAKHDSCAMPMTLTLKGLHCEGCEQTVKEELKAVKGVEEISVSAKKQQAVVWVCSHKKVTPEALKAAVKKAGYTVLKVEKGEPKTN